MPERIKEIVSQLLLFSLGQALFDRGLYRFAISIYKLAIQIEPDFELAYSYLGAAFEGLEKFTEVVSVFREAVQVRPRSPLHYYNLGLSLGQKTEAYESFHRAIELDPSFSYAQNSFLNLGSFDIRDVSHPQAVFLVGCGHSGTSLMLNILGSHPSIYPIPYESYIFTKKANLIQDTLTNWDNECLQEGKKIWVEKTPIHILYIQKILLYRPNCKFILLIRDGRDVVCSLRVREAYKDLSRAINRWVYDNLCGFPYWFHPQVKVIRYESLVVEPEKNLREIFNFLDEPYTDEVLNYHKVPKFWFSSEIVKPKQIETSEDYRNLRNWQINQPLFDGRGRWKQELNGDKKIMFKATAQKYLQQFGYVNDENW